MNIEKSLTYNKLMKGQKVLSYCVIADPPARETTTNYDKLMTDFLASDKSEAYKRSILSMLDYDYNKNFKVKEASVKVKEASVEDEMSKYNAILGSRLSEIKFKTFGIVELKKLAKNFKIRNFGKFRKQELIKKIESIKVLLL